MRYPVPFNPAIRSAHGVRQVDSCRSYGWEWTLLSSACIRYALEGRVRYGRQLG